VGQGVTRKVAQSPAFETIKSDSENGQKFTKNDKSSGLEQEGPTKNPMMAQDMDRGKPPS